MSKNKELSQDYFDRHPSSDSCHITSDGRVFHNAGAANGYATALKDNKVESFTRDGKKAEEVDVKGATVENPVIALADFNAETTTYEQGKALLAQLGLKAEGNKKAAVFAALTAAQEAAKTQE